MLGYMCASKILVILFVLSKSRGLRLVLPQVYQNFTVMLWFYVVFFYCPVVA